MQNYKICPVDPVTFWCERHQTKHEGRLYELSQADTAQGEKYRQLWDRQMKTITPILSKKPGGCGCGN